MNEDVLSKLHDIKNLEIIPDYSIFIFSFIIFIIILFLLIIIFFILKFLKNRKKSSKKIYLEKLQNLDFNDSKNFAYIFTKYSRLIVSNDREKKLANELIDELEKYKYKKDVKEITEAIKVKYSVFMDSLDV